MVEPKTTEDSGRRRMGRFRQPRLGRQTRKFA